MFAKTVKAEIMNIIVEFFFFGLFFVSFFLSVFVVVRYGDDLMLYLFTMAGGWGGLGWVGMGGGGAGRRGERCWCGVTLF